MSTKLYVGNLPFETTGEGLKETFSVHGEVVETRVITDKFSGRSRGFGFVEMTSAEDAKKAIEALNGTEQGGRKLVVNEARPQEDKRGGGGGGGGGRGPRSDKRRSW